MGIAFFFLIFSVDIIDCDDDIFIEDEHGLFWCIVLLSTIITFVFFVGFEKMRPDKTIEK